MTFSINRHSRKLTFTMVDICSVTFWERQFDSGTDFEIFHLINPYVNNPTALDGGNRIKKARAKLVNWYFRTRGNKLSLSIRGKYAKAKRFRSTRCICLRQAAIDFGGDGNEKRDSIRVYLIPMEICLQNRNVLPGVNN